MGDKFSGLRGYVFDGTVLHRARILNDRIVNVGTRQPIDGEPDQLPWLTYRRVENAVSRLAAASKPTIYADLNTIPYSPALMLELSKDRLSIARQTRDFIVKLLRVDAATADAMTQRLIDAVTVVEAAA